MAQNQNHQARAGGPGATTAVILEVGDGAWEGRQHPLEDAGGD